MRHVMFPNTADSTVRIMSPLREGDLVAKLSAVDVDDGANARVRYALRDASDLFELAERPGNCD